MQGNNNIKQVATKLNDLNDQSQLCRKVFAPTSGIFLGGTEPKKKQAALCPFVPWSKRQIGNPNMMGILTKMDWFWEIDPCVDQQVFAS